jgi:bis(5'-nucleosidyl)-tetraphosphatase
MPNQNAPNSQPEIVSAGFLILRQSPDQSVLLLKHPDRWDIPKGHCDPGETELETAWRELFEETGLNSEQVTLVPEFRWEHDYHVRLREHDDEPRLKRLVVFLGIVKSDPELTLTEHQGHRWFPWPPPLPIQAQTIDPLLSAAVEFCDDHPTLFEL